MSSRFSLWRTTSHSTRLGRGTLGLRTPCTCVQGLCVSCGCEDAYRHLIKFAPPLEITSLLGPVRSVADTPAVCPLCRGSLTLCRREHSPTQRCDRGDRRGRHSRASIRARVCRDHCDCRVSVRTVARHARIRVIHRGNGTVQLGPSAVSPGALFHRGHIVHGRVRWCASAARGRSSFLHSLPSDCSCAAGMATFTQPLPSAG